MRRGLGVRSGGVRVQPGRLHRARRSRAGGRPDRDIERQERIGYRSELIVGAADVDAHMKALFPDWRAKGVTVCLHEHQGGFAFNLASVEGLHGKCRSEGVAVLTGVEVTGSRTRRRNDHRGRDVSEGAIAVGEQVVIAPGPWAKRFWRMLGLPGHDRRPHAVGRRRRATGRCGRTGTSRRARSGRPARLREGGRRRAAGHPPRHGRPALHRRREARHRRALGHLLQARPPRRCRAALTARRRRRRRARPLPSTTDVDPASPTCGARRSRTR